VKHYSWITTIPWLPFLTPARAVSLSHSYYRPTLGVFVFHSLFLYLDMPIPPLLYWLRLFLSQTFTCINTLAISHCLFFSAYTTYEDEAVCSETLAHNIQWMGIYTPKKYNIAIAHRWQHLLSCGMFQTFTEKWKGFYEAVDESAFCI
jgi:hypothetical protein